MTTHSSILAWKIPQTEEAGGLRSMGSQRVRHDWARMNVKEKEVNKRDHTSQSNQEQLENVPIRNYKQGGGR